MGLGLQIPFAGGIPDSLSCIPESKARDDRFHKEKFQGFQNLDSLIWGNSVLMATGLLDFLDHRDMLIVGIGMTLLCMSEYYGFPG